MFHKRVLLAGFLSMAVIIHVLLSQTNTRVVSYLFLSTPGQRKKGPQILVVDPQTNPNLFRVIQHHGLSILGRLLEEKCSAYFASLAPSWKLLLYDEVAQDFERMVFELKQNWMKKKAQKDDVEYSDDLPDRFKYQAMYVEELDKTVKYQQGMVADIKALAAYSKCFEHADGARVWSSVVGAKPELQNLDERVYPYLLRRYPTYVRWNGERHYSPPDTSVPPLRVARVLEDMFETRSDPHFKIVNHTEPYFYRFKQQIGGKGIVMSVSDRFMADTSALLKALRVVGNTLPIQLVHRGDLSVANQVRLVEIARNELPITAKDEYNKLKSLNFAMFDPHLPPQDIWFVDVSNVLSKEHKDAFNGYLNKLLAYTFNLFDEMLLVDLDIVPYTNPEKFFESSQYRELELLFFKDRTHDERVQDFDTDFFHSMLPNEVDDAMFGVRTATNKTLGNRYMKLHFKHFMESGVVALKRSRYWDGIPISLQLLRWKPVMERVWGDKELFWLGLSIAGIESYQFNEYHVAAIGPLSKKDYNGAKELCLTHPGHISSDDNTLVWINLGVMTCKRADAAVEDFDRVGEQMGVGSVEDLERFYKSPLKITHAIIPPDAGLYKVKNEDGYPEKGWRMTDSCFQYFWCAYDSIGGDRLPEHQGQLFEFDETRVLWHDYIGHMYLG